VTGKSLKTSQIQNSENESFVLQRISNEEDIVRAVEF
jgi:hypothetical protein